MKRKVFLEGEMAEKFGECFEMNVSSFQEAFQLLEANFPELKKYLIECSERQVGFTCAVENEFLKEDSEILVPFQKGDFIICPVPAGSKSGAAKVILGGIIVAALLISTAGMAAPTLLGSEIAFNVALGVGINLALVGIQQMMAPDPSIDTDAPSSYLFNGTQQSTLEGDPIPILYGELRVPGKPIGFGISSASRRYTSGLSNSRAIYGKGSSGTYRIR